MLAIIFGIALVLYLLYKWYIQKYNYFSDRGVDGPKPKFPWGNNPNAFLRKKNGFYDLDDIYQEFRSKAPFVGYLELRQPKLLLIDPKVIQDVMITHFNNFRDNGVGKFIDKKSDPIFGRNPFMLEGDEWKAKRAEITPAFTSNRIRALFPLIEEVLARFSKYISDELNKGTKEPFDAREICAKFTTDAVSSCIFNADAQSFTKEKPEIREMGRQLFNFEDPVLGLKFMLLSIFPGITKFMKIRFSTEESEKFFLNLMQQAIELRQTSAITRDDYLAFLIGLRNKKEISEMDMAAHGVTFFIDGFETSSVAISSTLYEIGNDKKVQEKLRAQINSDLIGSDGKIIYEKMLNHEYLDQVFYEALRLHPPAVVTIRECNEDITLNGGNGTSFKVEKGFGVVIPIYSVHRNPDYYQHPDEFIPERFDPEHGGVKAFYDKGVLFPFGEGPRICLGRKFALMQAKAAIIEIVRKFEISVNIKTQRPLVIDPKQVMNYKEGGLWLDFKKI